MGRKKLSMSEKIRRHIAAHPQAKAKDIAEQLGVKVSLVYAVKYAKPKKPSPATKEINIDAVHDNFKEAVAKAVIKGVASVDVVNHPPHYKTGGIETIDFMQAKLTREEFIGYLKGNVLKYGSRLGKKDAQDVDAGKLAWYANKLRDVLSA